MPRTRHSLRNTSSTFSLKAFRISTSNTIKPINIVTLSSHPPNRHDVSRLPLVEQGLEGWPAPQSFVHDCDVTYRGRRYRIFFQRHLYLPFNPTLGIHGTLIIMSVGKKNVNNVVNSRTGDSRRVYHVARRFAPYLIRFQEHGRRLKPLIDL
ncbi:hypothetical protein BT96DRAFT_565200 [Gymnopus androsaceus JB14]|uniref:Uncharacterized protein n=1 Tax=Gymnopus androsaceus JB14 TaxID=1447944 RepID=A0A6A4GKT8_9AGAR|nr:hypothetical protein BT96DRAFT_565200 [Gymnopus androsaceus JB14]